MNLDDLKTLDIPLFSDELSKNTELLISKALDSISCAKKVYYEAEIQLRTILGSVTVSNKNHSIKTLAESFLKSSRLDAEYYQSKYDMYLAVLGKFRTTSIPEEFDVFKSTGSNYADSISDVGVIKTKQLTNSGVNTDGIESYFTFESCIENKSTFVINNDVVFASMGVGSLGKVSLFSYDGDKPFVTDSTLRIYRAKKHTHYDGYRFRSRLEARWAVFFNNIGLEYEYEMEGFDMEECSYLPDFYIPSIDRWFEIKGQPLTVSEVQKCEQFCRRKDNENIKFSILIGAPKPLMLEEEDFSILGIREYTWQWPSQMYPSDTLLLAQGLTREEYYSRFLPAILKVDGVDDKLLIRAIREARSARFEFGETPKGR